MGKILVLDCIMFDVLVLKQTCIIVIIKMAKLKEQKNKRTKEKHFFHNIEVCILLATSLVYFIARLSELH